MYWKCYSARIFCFCRKGYGKISRGHCWYHFGSPPPGVYISSHKADFRHFNPCLPPSCPLSQYIQVSLPLAVSHLWNFSPFFKSSIFMQQFTISFIYLFIHLFIWLHWVLVASHGSWAHRLDLWCRHVGTVVAASWLSCSSACGILVPQLGIEPMFPALQGGFLTTGPSGKSLGNLNIACVLRNSFALNTTTSSSMDSSGAWLAVDLANLKRGHWSLGCRLNFLTCMIRKRRQPTKPMCII